MPQIFPRRTNTLAWVSLAGLPLGGALVLWLCLLYTRSSYGTGAGVTRVQPVPFSHQHHAGDLGIDCRYCHTSVETSSYAGLPPTHTCMNCHSQMWVGSDVLDPVRASYRTNESLKWHRIYNLPGFVYFEHSIHVHKGVGCSECHGRIDNMPLTFQVPSLLMEWCLDCHRHPEQHLRPVEQVFDMKYEKPANQDELGRALAKKYEIRDTAYLTSCTVCHR
jgi:Cytochrome c7 and related cytochrome c